MDAHVGRKLQAAAALAAAMVSVPAAAAPVSLRSFAAEQMKMASIAYHIGVASAAKCNQPQMFTGLLLHDLTQYDPTVRPAVARAFSLGAGLGVIQLVPGSAAERAGLAVDDEILAIDGVSVVDAAAAIQPKKSYARIDQAEALLQSHLRRGPVELVVRRHGTPMRLTMDGAPGCGGSAKLLDSKEVNAWSDGRQVVLTTGITELARSDGEVAFVVAHEMAHNILGHANASSRRSFGFGLGFARARRSELEADQLAVELMRNGGYAVQSGVTMLRTAGRRYWWALSLDHPSFGRRIQVVNAAIAALAPPIVMASASPSQPKTVAWAKRTIAEMPPAEAKPVALASADPTASSWCSPARQPYWSGRRYRLPRTRVNCA